MYSVPAAVTPEEQARPQFIRHRRRRRVRGDSQSRQPAPSQLPTSRRGGGRPPPRRLTDEILRPWARAKDPRPTSGSASSARGPRVGPTTTVQCPGLTYASAETPTVSAASAPGPQRLAVRCSLVQAGPRGSFLLRTLRRLGGRNAAGCDGYRIGMRCRAA